MKRWVLLAIAVVVGTGGPGTVCTRGDDDSERPLIVVEPSNDDQPTVVRLNTAGGPADDPLTIGAFTLTDQNGDVFSSQQLAGHEWVAAFIFTRCAGYCPMLVRNLRLEIADRVDDPDVRFVVVSVDPEFDTPARLKQYAEIFVNDFDRWVFLTGDKADIYKLVQHGFRLPLQEMQGQDRVPGAEVAHSLSLIHVGEDGRILGKYNSRDEQEVLALRRVLNGQIETPAENRIPPPPSAVGTPANLKAAAPVERPQKRMAQGLKVLPAWAARLPVTNAMLNGLATVLLLAGYTAIRRGHILLHKRLMLFAFGTSIVFLGCYLTYHFALHHSTGTHGKPFAGTGNARTAYLSILISHVLLAMLVPVLALVTISRGLNEQWVAHRRIAKITFPIWLYVSVTGVIIYGMLYHWPG